MRVSYVGKQMFTDNNVYSFWWKWGLSKLKEGKQMFTSLVNKCLFAIGVNKQGGIVYTPVYPGVYPECLLGESERNERHLEAIKAWLQKKITPTVTPT